MLIITVNFIWKFQNLADISHLKVYYRWNEKGQLRVYLPLAAVQAIYIRLVDKTKFASCCCGICLHSCI